MLRHFHRIQGLLGRKDVTKELPVAVVDEMHLVNENKTDGQNDLCLPLEPTTHCVPFLVKGEERI